MEVYNILFKQKLSLEIDSDIFYGIVEVPFVSNAGQKNQYSIVLDDITLENGFSRDEYLEVIEHAAAKAKEYLEKNMGFSVKIYP